MGIPGRARTQGGRRIRSYLAARPEGIAVKPLYTADDLDGIGHLGSLPGFDAVRARPARDDVRRPAVDDPAICGILDG
ncbi:hypothetical protein [Ensifer canadensis]